MGTLWLALAITACDADRESASQDLAAPDQSADGLDAMTASDASDVMADATGELVPFWFTDGVLDEAGASLWLRMGAYRAWTASSAVRPSTQPEGGSRVYFNAALAGSLMIGAELHPVGSMAIREIYDRDLRTLRIVNLLVKRESVTGDGAEWVFMELTELQPGGRNPSALVDPPECMTCHAPPSDRIISTWPLD